jgi:hypothetical protein
MEKFERKSFRQFSVKQPTLPVKGDNKPAFTPTEMWKARQLREHHRDNGLCFKCGDKYSLGHKCPEILAGATHAQLTALMAQAIDGGGMLSDDLLDALEMHVPTVEEECFLSIHAIAGTQSTKVPHLRALVNN